MDGVNENLVLMGNSFLVVCILNQIIDYGQKSVLCVRGTVQVTGSAGSPACSRAYGRVCGRFYMVNRGQEGLISLRLALRNLRLLRIGTGTQYPVKSTGVSPRPKVTYTPLSPRLITR